MSVRKVHVHLTCEKRGIHWMLALVGWAGITCIILWLLRPPRFYLIRCTGEGTDFPRGSALCYLHPGPMPPSLMLWLDWLPLMARCTVKTLGVASVPAPTSVGVTVSAIATWPRVRPQRNIRGSNSDQFYLKQGGHPV